MANNTPAQPDAHNESANGGAVKAAPSTYPNATAAMAELRKRNTNLRFCGNRAKGKAFERAWQDEPRPSDPANWPAKWRGAEEFCLVPSTAGLFLVDVDAAYDGVDGAERRATKEEASALVAALGGRPYLYESTQGKSSWHVLYADTANGGRDWSALKGAGKSGFASANGLLWRGDGDVVLKFDTRGGGLYTDGAKAGKVCGCRIDANRRRLTKLIAALDHGVTPLENPQILADAFAARNTWGKPIGGTAKGGAHSLILERARGIARLPDDDAKAALAELAREVANERAKREGNTAGFAAELATATDEVDRAFKAAREFAQGGAERPVTAFYDDETAESVQRAIAAVDIELRYNIRGGDREEWRENGGEWEVVGDQARAHIREVMACSLFYPPKKGSALLDPYRLSPQMFRERSHAIMRTVRVDPFAQWLDELPAWDGEGRLWTWLPDVFDCEGNDPDLVAWASAFLPLGAVWRTRKPGTKLDELPVLIGERGIGKSSAIAALIPPEHQMDWFVDSLKLSEDDKRKSETIEGRVIAEFGEMQGASVADREGIKAFLSRRDDGGHRGAYAHNPEPRPRRCVFVGTGNPGPNLPNDPAGNRNFVIVNVRRKSSVATVVEHVDAIRLQLWAEAVALYNDGQTAWLPVAFAKAQARVNEGARSADLLFEDAIEVALAKRERGKRGPFTTQEIMVEAKILLPDEPLGRTGVATAKRVANVLRLHRYVVADRRESRKGKQVRVWVRK